ncbi:hypothetical protein KKF84_09690 [Myxococcota bacterium]|nr:hypothetical protein [Myxococcota bacterium]MBU1535583.1 hypothetical protein [Myxococcota bacterium]
MYKIHALLLLTVLVFSVACRKKDPDELDRSQWVNRNLTCAEDSIVTIIHKLETKAKEAQALSAKLKGILTSKGCPLGTHLECTPELGIQAIATYLSTATVAVPKSQETAPKAPAVGENKVPGTETIIKELNKNNSHQLKDIYPDMPKKAVEPQLKAKKLDTSELGLAPSELAARSLCGVTVKKTCKFETLDSVVSQLAIFTKQAQILELEASKVLSLASTDPYGATVESLYLGVRNLEANIQSMVTLEEAVDRKKKEYYGRYESVKPLKIKGIIVDLAMVIPTVVSSRLKSYIPKMKTILADFKKRRPDYTEKLNAALRDMKRAKRQNANACLDKKGCWKFRACVQRYRLPGISLYKN